MGEIWHSSSGIYPEPLYQVSPKFVFKKSQHFSLKSCAKFPPNRTMCSRDATRHQPFFSSLHKWSSALSRCVKLLMEFCIAHILLLVWSRPPLPRTKLDLNSWEKFFLSQDCGTCGSLGGAGEAQIRCKPIIPIFTRSNRIIPPHQLPTCFHRFCPLSLLCQKSSASSLRRC